jgi:hypothetical protein
VTAGPLLLSAALLCAEVPPPRAPLASDAAARRRSSRLVLAGGVVLAASTSWLGVMAYRLAASAQLARAYNDAVAPLNAEGRPPTPDERRHLEFLAIDGRSSDRVALAFGVTGGALLLVGAALLGRGLALRRAARLGPLAVPRGGGIAWSLAF